MTPKRAGHTWRVLLFDDGKFPGIIKNREINPRDAKILGNDSGRLALDVAGSLERAYSVRQREPEGIRLRFPLQCSLCGFRGTEHLIQFRTRTRYRRHCR